MFMALICMPLAPFPAHLRSQASTPWAVVCLLPPPPTFSF